MNEYIKYKRICKLVTEQEIDEIFREIISSGNEIIFYNEKQIELPELNSENKFQVTMITGKRRAILFD